MHPTLLTHPVHHPGWIYEEKVDGYRMVAYKDGDAVQFISRLGKDFTRRFPELVSALAGLPVDSLDTMKDAALRLRDMGARNVLIKGGHLNGPALDLLLAEDGQFHQFSSNRIDTPNTHGTGCTYSAAITAGLAKGIPLPVAIARAKQYVTEAIRTNPRLGHGHGPLNYFAPAPE